MPAASAGHRGLVNEIDRTQQPYEAGRVDDHPCARDFAWRRKSERGLPPGTSLRSIASVLRAEVAGNARPKNSSLATISASLADSSRTQAVGSVISSDRNRRNRPESQMPAFAGILVGSHWLAGVSWVTQISPIKSVPIPAIPLRLRRFRRSSAQCYYYSQ